MKKTLSPNVVNMLLSRLKNEYEAFYLYRHAKNWCADKGFEKAGEYFEKESNDELAHAKKLEEFLTDWNVLPVLPQILTPENLFNNLADIINSAYNIEYNLYCAYEETSMELFNEGNVGVFDFLKEFRDIQNASVAEYSNMISKLEGVDTGDKFKMLLLQEELF